MDCERWPGNLFWPYSDSSCSGAGFYGLLQLISLERDGNRNKTCEGER